MGREHQIRVCIEVNLHAASWSQGGSIRFADQTTHQHFSRIEDVDDSLAIPQLIAFLGMAIGVSAKDILICNHPGKRSVDLQPVDVGLSSFHGYFLPITL